MGSGSDRRGTVGEIQVLTIAGKCRVNLAIRRKVEQVRHQTTDGCSCVNAVEVTNEIDPKYAAVPILQ